MMKIDLTAVIGAVKIAGYGDDIQWAENIEPPETADEFAREVIFVICNSGMRFTVAQGIFDRVMKTLERGGVAFEAFKHVAKSLAIDKVWQGRLVFFGGYVEARDKLEYLGNLPWIGEITKYHLAKNFGLQYAKPDVHMQRLAATFKTTPQALCESLAREHELKVATIDTLLWRAAAIGKLDTSTGEVRP